MTVSPRWPALTLPATTACVPWYRPHSSAPNVALMMKATSMERTSVRLRAVSNAFSVDTAKRSASRGSCV